MALSLYDVTVRSFLQGLAGATGFLGRGLDHCRDNNIDSETLVETRLWSDMHPLRFQIVSVVNHSIGAIEAVKAGLFTPPSETPPLNYAALQSLVANAKGALSEVDAREIDALQGRDMVFKVGDRAMNFVAEDFLLSFSLPNFYFHAATAYDILRSKGVPLGKRDFLGQPRMKA